MSAVISRLVYSVFFYLGMPLVWLRLLWRSRSQPGYLSHFGERHGFYPSRPDRPLLWLHAVSVGETRAATPLIGALLAAYPQHSLLLTHMTPTGRDAGAEVASRHPGRIVQAYLPYDLPDACARFLDHFRPRLGLIMETEVWPNVVAVARQRDLPVALINARLSRRSARGYARLAPLIRPAFGSLSAVAAQSEADADRLRQVGAVRIRVCGNLKFDVQPAAELLDRGAAWRRSIGRRPVWVAASTREGEEALILDALAASDVPGLLLLIVPRHPQRFDEVAALVASRGLRACRRSAGELPGPAHQVWIGDSMGEMAAYYALADLALIGGTLLPFGGQNLIEAAACGCPVLIGPHSFNFAQASSDALASGAARRVTDAGEAAALAAALLADPAQLAAMRAAAATFSELHRGATERILALVGELMAARAGR